MTPRSDPPRLPGWIERLARIALPSAYAEEMIGDLQEGFARRSGQPGPALRWALGQVVRSLPASLRLRIRLRADSRTSGTRMESLLKDLRFGFRGLRRTPGFAVVATLTLALAVGVNTSVFSLVSAIVFADLPMQETETVSILRSNNAELGVERGLVSVADFLDLRERATSFESIDATTERPWVMSDGDRPERVAGLAITPGMPEAWRLPPTLGRSFAEEESAPGAPDVVMLSHTYWQSRFGGRPDVIGETLRLDGRDHTVIGVMNEKFEFASFAQAQLLTPLRLDRGDASRSSRSLFVTGRLHPGVSHDAARGEVARIGRQLEAEYPGENRGWGLASLTAREALVNDESNRILLLLQLTVGMVILIACANVANMLLARATARRRELAVRSALGAGRSRLVRQMLTESLVISVAACALGLAFARGLNDALVRISSGAELAFVMAEIDGKVLAFTLAISVLTPLLFGLLPALRASREASAGVLRDGRSSDGGRAGKRLRAALVTTQVAMALTLMIVATLITRTVVHLTTQPLGYDEAGLLTASVSLPEAYDDPESRSIFFDEARRAISTSLGGDEVVVADGLPGIRPNPLTPFDIEGAEPTNYRASPFARLVTMSPSALGLLGIPVASGRGFQAQDRSDAPRVAIVSRELAQRHWPDTDPIGRRIRVSGSDEWVEIVGVASDVGVSPTSEGSSVQPPRNLYLSAAQFPPRSMYLVTRTDLPTETAAAAVREAVWSVDGDLPVDRVQTASSMLKEARGSSRGLLTLFLTFAVFALLMASIGIYGVMSYSVEQRRSEMGVRLALGADVSNVRWLVLRQGGRLLLIGLCVGWLAGLAMSRLLASVVVGVSATDPLTFIAMPALLGLVALVANWIPAVRATRTNPAGALRDGA